MSLPLIRVSARTPDSVNMWRSVANPAVLRGSIPALSILGVGGALGYKNALSPTSAAHNGRRFLATSFLQRKAVFQQEERFSDARTPKSIALLGATGNTGRHVLLVALARGHSVKALARDPQKLVDANSNRISKEQSSRLSIVQGDAAKKESIAELLQDCDCVISCIGARSRGDTIMTTTVANLKSAAADLFSNPSTSAPVGALPPTLIMMSSIGCAGTSGFVKFSLSCIAGFGAISDMDLADSQVRAEGFPIPFVVVRPPMISDSVPRSIATPADQEAAAEGSPYRASLENPTTSDLVTGSTTGMTQQAVATFLVDCAEEGGKWTGRGVQIYGV